MRDKSPQLQDVFLNQVRKERVPLTVFLMNGVKLQGVISWFDSFSILLKRDNAAQLVYKHAISTIMPSHPINLYDPDEDNGDDEKKSKNDREKQGKKVTCQVNIAVYGMTAKNHLNRFITIWVK